MSQATVRLRVEKELDDLLSTLSSSHAKQWSIEKKKLADQILSKSIDPHLEEQVRSQIIGEQSVLFRELLSITKKVEHDVSLLKDEAYYFQEEQKAYDDLIQQIRVIRQAIQRSSLRGDIEKILHQQHDALHQKKYSTFVDLVKSESKFMIAFANAVGPQPKKLSYSTSPLKKIKRLLGIVVGSVALASILGYYGPIATSKVTHIHDVHEMTYLLVEAKEQVHDHDYELAIEKQFEHHSGIQIYGIYTQKDIKILRKIYDEHKSLFKKGGIDKIIFAKGKHSDTRGKATSKGVIVLRADTLDEFIGYKYVLHEIYHHVFDTQKSFSLRRKWNRIKGGLVSYDAHRSYEEDMVYFLTDIDYLTKHGHKKRMNSSEISSAIKRVELLLEHNFFPADVAHRLKNISLTNLFE